MKPTLSLLLFSVLVCMQLFVSASMILKQETVLTKGLEYKLRSRPVDPYDALRGRYVRITYDATAINVPQTLQKNSSQQVYALLETDDEGFCVVKGISDEKPGGSNYLKVRLGPTHKGKANVGWPFDRYYMEEFKAPRAETAYRSLETGSEAYTTVRIYEGTGVITGLYIDGVSIEEKIKNEE